MLLLDFRARKFTLHIILSLHHQHFHSPYDLQRSTLRHSLRSQGRLLNLISSSSADFRLENVSRIYCLPAHRSNQARDWSSSVMDPSERDTKNWQNNFIQVLSLWEPNTGLS